MLSAPTKDDIVTCSDLQPLTCLANPRKCVFEHTPKGRTICCIGSTVMEGLPPLTPMLLLT